MKSFLRQLLPDGVKAKIRWGLGELSLLKRRLVALIGTKIPEGAVLLQEKGAHTYFGYYDVCPFHPIKSIILAVTTPLGIVSPHDCRGAVLNIGYYDLEMDRSRFIKIGETLAWNWQQGCRLQWVQYDDKPHILFNVYEQGELKSVLYDFENKVRVKVLKRAVYSVQSSGVYAITVNFSRLHFFRPGYGYSNCMTDESALKAEGVWRLNMQTDESKLIVDFQRILQVDPLECFGECEHYLNHLSFSPSGNKFLFFHLWIDKSGKRDSRILISDVDGEILQSFADDIRASHYCWLDEERILLTGNRNRSGFGYYIINLNSGDVVVYGADVLVKDGHPSLLSCNVILSDSYPDEYGYQDLFTYDDSSKNVKILGRFYLPVGYKKELRCDLHPRLSHDNKFACVDMIHKHKRAMCIVPIV